MRTYESYWEILPILTVKIRLLVKKRRCNDVEGTFTALWVHKFRFLNGQNPKKCFQHRYNDVFDQIIVILVLGLAKSPNMIYMSACRTL